MGEIAASLEEYRQETNSVLIADTNELIGRVVDSSDTPFIYERTGTWINSYMLDEFQDTSRKQYSNFKPLLRDTLDSGNPNLVIGDSKQAIYRFRNADPSIFRDEIYRDFARYLMQENLDTNWRSHRNIVYFNNEFTHRMLAYFAGHHTLENTYKPTGNDTDYRQKLSPAKVDKPGGLVRVHFRPSDSSEAFEKGIDVTTSLIDHLLDMHRRFDWKDINILVNTKKDGKVIVDAVIAHNMDNPDSEIPIVSGEMMLLSQSTAVRRVIGMLHFIDLTSYAMAADATDVPDDKDYDDVKKRVARNRMKKQRQFKVLEDFEREMGNRELDPTVAGDLLETCFDAANAIARHDTQQQMEIYAEDLNKRLPDQNTHTMSLLNIVEHLVRSIGQDERDTENLFLHALLNYVVDFASRRNGGTVREFLQYWEQKKDKLTVPDAGNVDAIQVYTIHKAKGLEAHCVVIPCAGWELDNNPQDKEYWVDAKTWLDCGGRKLLDEVAPGQWNEQMIPPILALGKSAVRNIIRANGLFADIVARKDEELLIDNVNKTYVAFTRPRMELHIYCVGSERNSTTTTNLNHVLKDLIRDSQDHMGFVEKENGAYYDLGNPMPDIDRNVTTPSGNRDRKPNNYTTRPLPPYVVSNSAINVVLPVDEAPGAMMNSEMGSRLHAVMSRLAYAGQLNKVLGYCERRGIITPGEKKSLHDFLADRLSKQPYASWFADDNFVYNERTMLVKDRPSLRPDRIVRHKDGSFSIIDYKFGKYNDEYETQLKGYRNHIAKITGRTARSFLWFINLSSGEDNIIEV